MTVLDEEVPDWNVPPLPAGEEVLQEEIAARAAQPTLPGRDAPEVIVEGPPVLLVQRLLRFFGTSGPEEDEIAKEVGREERLTARV